MQKTALYAVVFWTASAFCQTPANEPDTLRGLLSEVHQLRQDIEGMTVASQRVQIAVYALQAQDAAVARSAQRLDSVRGKCSDLAEHRQQTAMDVQRLENSIVSGAAPQAVAEAGKERLSEVKGQLEIASAQVQTCQAGEAEASTQLRNDQAKLVDLQDRIARLDEALEQFSSATK